MPSVGVVVGIRLAVRGLVRRDVEVSGIDKVLRGVSEEEWVLVVGYENAGSALFGLGGICVDTFVLFEGVAG